VTQGKSKALGSRSAVIKDGKTLIIPWSSVVKNMWEARRAGDMAWTHRHVGNLSQIAMYDRSLSYKWLCNNLQISS
jgi:hypothetical protein